MKGTSRGSWVDRIFEAILEGEEAASQLLREDPARARARASRDRLVEAIPHWIYVGDTGLHLAAAALCLGAARLLLDAGADPVAQNRRGATPLHYACDARPGLEGAWNPAAQTSLIELIVDRGGEIDRGDQGGATALHRAVRARSVVAVRQLLEQGARTECVLKKSGASALHLAAQSTGASGTAGLLGEQLEIIALLLEHGADPAARDASGRTPAAGARSEAVAAALQGRRLAGGR
jgi:ankyrin repeat protein